MAVEFLFTDSEKELFIRLSVNALILFGSHAQDKEHKSSDFDVGVLVKDKTILSDHERRVKIYDSLYDILSSHIKRLVNIDIVFLETAPGELQSHVAKYGRPIFEAGINVFADFRERVIESYSDFAPLRQIFQEGILERIN